MYKPTNHKEKVIHRLKIVRGHLEKILAMVETDAYCMDVLLQSKAVQQALAKVDEQLLEHHLSTCVVKHIQAGQEEQAIAEVMKVFTKK